MKIVFLYSRLADYFFRCVQHIAQHQGIDCYIFNNPPDKDAPYQFQNETNLTILNRKDYSPAELLEKIDEIKPNIMYVSGWADKGYNQITRIYSKKIPVLMCCDNPWENTLKQNVLALFFSFVIRNLCTHIWAAGRFQYEYARRLGFAESNVIMGIYCANTPVFERVYQQRKERKIFQKTILYVSRFVGYKKPDWLLDCFMELEQEGLTDWKLLMIGEGELRKELATKAKGNVEIRGFVPPSELPTLFSEAGVFCLPAEREHWGVVVHEAAAAGMPMLLSDTCGAGNDFLINGYNGFSYQTGNRQSFKDALRKMMLCDETLLKNMAERSFKLSQRITLDTWAGTLMSVLNS